MKQIAWATFDSYAASLLAIVSIAVVGRVLTPNEIGVFATASIFVGIATVFRDFGVSNYLIQLRSINQRDINAAAFVAQVLAIGASLLIFVLAYPIAQFYSEPRLVLVLGGLAINLLLLPRISIVLALLRRDMRFDLLVSVTFFMSLALNAGTIVFALLGAGFMSMVYGAILSNVVGLYLSSRKRLVISYKYDKSIIRSIFSFGVMSTSSNLLRDARSYLNGMVLGKTQGMDVVAYQSKAFSIMALFWGAVMPGVYSFTLPHFAKEIRGGCDIRAKFLSATAKTMCVALPVLAFLAVEGDALILLLNGPQWGISAEVGRFVPAIYLIGFPLIALVGTLLTAGGYVKDTVKIQLYSLPPKVAVLLALMYEPLRVFIIYNVLVEMVVESVLFAYHLRHRFCISVMEVYRSSLSSYVLTACFAAVIFFSRIVCEGVVENAVMRMAIQGGVGIAVWFFLIGLFSNPLREDIAGAYVAIRDRIKLGFKR
ncbi:oligosaccharide flippase family protein [Propionivibrio sp.]|uniref:oligosaccharide flippase family protein n=1 Tax=Propionivibrio sp. TaxID=2212460 RepID=UPI003BF06250